MLEVGFERVDVQSVADRSEVSRTTFCRYFAGKDGLLMAIMTDAIDGIKEAMQQAWSPRDEAVLKYRYITGIPKICRVYLSLPVDNPARQMIRQEFAEMLLERYGPQGSNNIPMSLAVKQIQTYGDEFLAWYVDNLDSCSPEEAAAIYGDLVVRSTTHVAFKLRKEWLASFN